MEETVPPPLNGTTIAPSVAPPPTPTPSPEEQAQRRKMIITAVVAAVIILAFVGGSVYLLLQPETQTDKIRDVFIIFMAVESLLIGLVLVILIVQLAQLINLLQNEIKPILNSTNETVNTLRGTAVFLSDNLTEPVMKLNEFLAAFNSLRGIFGSTKRK
jgi:amino acid permease